MFSKIRNAHQYFWLCQELRTIKSFKSFLKRSDFIEQKNSKSEIFEYYASIQNKSNTDYPMWVNTGMFYYDTLVRKKKKNLSFTQKLKSENHFPICK